MRIAALALALMACGGGRTAASSTPADAGVQTPDSTPVTASDQAPSTGAEGAEGAAPAQATLHGTPVTPPRPVTPFEGVLAHTGKPRSLDALQGHPTVVWFFPMAGTPG